ncbi:MAG: ROK family protein, partial [Eubacteriales bacterium]|nr:ROK family protein [Eubacteriales bacterium]
NGSTPAYWRAEAITAKTVAMAAYAGDPAALEVFALSADALGRGLALLLDFLNPDCVVLGSVYARCHDLLEPGMRAVLNREALPRALAACRILPAQLGDHLGDYAALALAKAAAEA